MASTEEKANIAHVERSSNNSANDVDGLAAAFEKGRDPELSDAHLCSEADNKRILRKTGCSNRTEAATYAHRSGLT